MNLLRILRFWLLPIFGMFFAAGESAFASLGAGLEGGGIGDGGGAEPSAGEGGEPSGEPSAGEGEGDPEEQAIVDKLKPVTGTPGPGLKKPLTTGERAALASVKEKDPAAWKAINSRLYALDGMDKKVAEHFPEGGLDAAIQMKTTVDTFLAEQGVPNLEEVGKEVNGYRQMDKQILAGDVSFLKEMPPEMLGGLYNMMPQFVNQWADNPETKPVFENFFAGLVVATMRDSEVTLNLRDAVRDLERMGTDNADVKEVYDRVKGIQDWLKKFETKAATPPEKKAAAGGGDSDKVKELQTKIQQTERGQARGRVGTALNAKVGGKIMTIFKSVCGGKIPDHVNVGEVMTRMRSNLIESLGQSTHDRIEQYLDGGDEQGAIKYLLQQTTDQKLTDAITKAYKHLYKPSAMGSGAPRPAASTTTQTRPGATNTPQKGVTQIAYNPKYQSIDRAATEKWAKELGIPYARLVTQNKAVLKTGKRVQWAAEADNEQ